MSAGSFFASASVLVRASVKPMNMSLRKEISTKYPVLSVNNVRYVCLVNLRYITTSFLLYNFVFSSVFFLCVLTVFILIVTGIYL